MASLCYCYKMYACVCMYAYVSRYIYIQRQLGSLFVVCIYVVSELTTLQWATSKGAHPWERLILLPAVIVASGVELGKIPPFHVNRSYVIAIVLVLSAAISRTDCLICFTVDLLVFCLLQFLPQLPKMQELWCRCTHWDWIPLNLLISVLYTVVPFCDRLHCCSFLLNFLSGKFPM